MFLSHTNPLKHGGYCDCVCVCVCMYVHMYVYIQWTLDSRTVLLMLEQLETRIKIRKSNRERGIAQHRAAHAAVRQQLRTRPVECCWSVCASVRPLLP